MKVLKSLVTVLFWLLIIALMVMPLGLISQISRAEMEEYATPSIPVLQEVSMGDAVQCYRTDVAEYITVSGTFTSNTYVYMELKNVRKLDTVRWNVSNGDEIQEGQVLGSNANGDIIAEYTGIIAEMNTYGTNPYLKIQLFEPVEFSCKVEDRVLSVLKRSEGLTTENGENVTLVFASRQKNPDGTTNVRLSIESDSYIFGQTEGELKLLTGMVYRNTLVLPAKCVYQKDSGEDQPWYVRQVTRDGVFLYEQEVKVGYATDDIICVSGIEEGGWFDSGYKSVSGG